MSQVKGNKETVYTNVPAGYTTTTSTYAPGQATTTSNIVTAPANTSYYTTYQQPVQTYEYVTSAQPTYTTGTAGYTQGATTYTTGTTGYTTGSAGYTTTSVAGQKAVATDIPVESRIEYIPFEKKYVEYEQVEKVYQVPVETEVIEYEEVVRNERVPVERTITDYYAVETQVEYIRREIEETIMVQEPVERVYERVQYIPVETQIVHYPQRDNYVPQPTKTRTEYVGIQGQATGAATTGYQTYSAVQQGSRVGTGATYTTTNYVAPATTTTSYQTGYVSQPVGANYQTTYVQQQPATTTTTYVQQQPTTTTYQTGYVQQQPATTTYQTGYVTGGSGVRQGGYVTGGSGVRGANTTYVSTSNVKGTSYDTTANYY